MMKSKQDGCDVVVIGAGAAGLTTAFYLKRAGLRTVVIEQRSRPGGVVETKSVDGYLLEYGPNSTVYAASVKQLITDLSLESEVLIAGRNGSNRYIAIEGRSGAELAAAPRGFVEAITTPILSGQGKLRLLAEPFVSPSRRKDESVLEFVSRRFGRETAERLVDPLLGGIWAADISKLSTRTGLSRLWELEQTEGSVIGGFLKRGIRRAFGSRQPALSASKGELISFRRGMSQLQEVLAREVETGLQLNCTAAALEPAAEGITVRTVMNAVRLANSSPNFAALDGYEIEVLNARHAVIAVDAEPAAALIEPLYKEASDFIGSIPYAPIGILHIAVEAGTASQPFDGFGFLTPRKLGGVLLGAIFNSALFEGRAPAGFELLTCFIGGATQPDKADPHNPEILQAALTELRKLLGATGELKVLDKTYMPRAIPNYPLGHRRTQERIEELERTLPQLTVLGNWRIGTGLYDRITAGAEAAEKIIARLR